MGIARQHNKNASYGCVINRRVLQELHSFLDDFIFLSYLGMGIWSGEEFYLVAKIFVRIVNFFLTR